MKQSKQYIKLASYEAKPGNVKKVLLLYSGGLDTSCMLKWIQEVYKAEVITFTADLGQSDIDLKFVKKKALKTGASVAIVEDLKDEFADNYVSLAVKANGLYGDKYPMSSSIARYLIAKRGVELCKEYNADTLAHGCTGKGNDQIRFDLTAVTLNPKIKVLAPVREWSMTRSEEIKYAKKHGILVSATVESPYSIDDNLWGKSTESGILEEPDKEPPADVFTWTTLPENAPDKPTYITLEFEKGIPVALNKNRMKLSELIIKLNKVAGENGIGIIDHIENRVVGLKSREVYECPAAVTILEAHNDLEKMVCSTQEDYFRTIIEDKWSQLAFSGLWFDPLMSDLNCFLDKVNHKVTGWVKLKLYKGNMRVVGRGSKYSLYSHGLVSFDDEHKFNQLASAPFIEHYGNMSKMAYHIASRLG